ncbi:hypothetical protein R1flu_013573 [Riccia fluitans]|uniref:Seipin n=1 Tax=Riccia fluitans TaxID=41844 RepID=A0ABD1YGT1_9MARC
MEELRSDDSVTFGDDSAEENYHSATDNIPKTSAGAGSVLNSVRSSVKSAVEYMNEANLGPEGDQFSERKRSGLDDTRKGRKKDEKGTTEENVSGKPETEENSIEDQETSGSGTSEDWSVVGPFPETQSLVLEDEKQGVNQADVKGHDPSHTAETKALKTEAEESTLGSSPAKLPANSAAESSTPKHGTADNARKSQRKIDDSQLSSHGAPSPKSSVSGVPPLSFGDRTPSLRRRSRTPRSTDASPSSVESGVAGSYSPGGQALRSHERHSSGLKDKPKGGRHESDNRTASDVDTIRAAKGLLQAAESDASEVVTSPGRFETIIAKASEENRKVEAREPKIKIQPPGEQERKATDFSGYDSDTDEDEAGSGLTRLERRPVFRGTKNEEEAASSNGQDGEVSGRIQRREVYTIPDTDGELGEGGSSNQLLSWPAELLVQAVAYQVKLIFQIMSFSFVMFNFFTSVLTWPIHHTIMAKDRATDMATGAVNQGFGLVSQLREGVAQTGPLVTKLSKKTVMGCLGSAYVIFVLSLLLVPAFFLDLLIVGRMVEEPVQLRETLNFDYTQARPSAIVSVLSGQDLEKAKSLPLDKLVSYRRIAAGHNFQVNVILTMPESEYNLRLGMFQVTAETLSARNQVLMRQSKPCILPYRSALIRLFKTVVYSVPLLMGFSSEAQRLEVTVLQAQEKVIPTASVRILLEPKAGYPQGGGLPELYGSELRLESVLPWPKAIIHRWKWTFYVWNGVSLFLFEVAMVLCCCRQLLLPGLGGGTPNVENIVTGEVKRPSKPDAAAKKPRKRRVQFEDDMPLGAVPEGAGSSPSLESRLEEADRLSSSSEDSDADAGWSMPPLEEAISTVEEGVKAMEETVKTLGESIVGGVSEGLGQVFSAHTSS